MEYSALKDIGYWFIARSRKCNRIQRAYIARRCVAIMMLILYKIDILHKSSDILYKKCI